MIKKLMPKLKDLVLHPLTLFLLFAFLVTSWPFIYYPLTDGDIANWTDVANEIRTSNIFFTGTNDQGHGPLLAWTAGIFSKVAPHSFYAYGFFNMLLGMFGVWVMYFLGKKIWPNEKITYLSLFLFTTSLAYVYLSRTPLYDWPATIMYFTYASFYFLYTKERKLKYHLIALLAIGIGSLSRFSICMGLAGIFMLLTSFIYKRSIKNIIFDGLSILLAIGLINFPWLVGQISSHGDNFFLTFLYDNTGRYIKSTRPNSTYLPDFYSFPLYVLVGFLPHTFCLISTFFQKGILSRIKKDKLQQVLLAGFLPCLLLFTFSGHTKLGRYIAYVFPFLTMMLAYNMYKFDLPCINYRHKIGKITLGTSVLLGGLLLFYSYKFSQEATEGVLLTVSIIILLFSLLFITYYIVRYRYHILLEKPWTLLWLYGLVYMLFFTVLTYETFHVSFLKEIRQGILNQVL
jgi:4-amino-4-deoxy-L-arabinose transferase-like glycosyltransferase